MAILLGVNCTAWGHSLLFVRTAFRLVLVCVLRVGTMDGTALLALVSASVSPLVLLYLLVLCNSPQYCVLKIFLVHLNPTAMWFFLWMKMEWVVRYLFPNGPQLHIFAPGKSTLFAILFAILCLISEMKILIFAYLNSNSCLIHLAGISNTSNSSIMRHIP